MADELPSYRIAAGGRASMYVREVRGKYKHTAAKRRHRCRAHGVVALQEIPLQVEELQAATLAVADL